MSDAEQEEKLDIDYKDLQEEDIEDDEDGR